MADDPTNPIVPQRAVAYPDRLTAGMKAGDYVIEDAIAAGGCGTVYRARHQLLGRRVAIKVLSRELADSREMLKRFEREAKAVNHIQHPNIVDVIDFSKLADGRPYYVMELLDGVSLGEQIKRHGRFAPAEALEILEPVCAALQAAHDKGIVHRDLKGGNIMIVAKGDQKTVKLLDFGIAKLIHPEPGEAGLTTSGRRLGTPSAMAPEQFRGDPVDARTDVYALGVLLYRLLTSQLPFQGTTTEEIERSHLNAPPPPPSRIAPISPAMDAIVLRCLEKKPERRYPSVVDFIAALRDAVAAQDPRKAGQKVLSLGAIAIYVEARTAPDPPEEADDALLDDLTRVLDTAEQRLRAGGLLIPLQTGSALLGVLLLPDQPEQNRDERRRALGVALPLYRELAARPTADPRIHVNVCVHADKALIRSSNQGPEIIGGAILAIGAWVPQENADGLCATAHACEGLPGLNSAPAGGRYMTIR
jgi:tRNA A-37 threonylcarbamoyl transferase component Bud32